MPPSERTTHSHSQFHCTCTKLLTLRVFLRTQHLSRTQASPTPRQTTPSHSSLVPNFFFSAVTLSVVVSFVAQPTQNGSEKWCLQLQEGGHKYLTEEDTARYLTRRDGTKYNRRISTNWLRLLLWQSRRWPSFGCSAIRTLRHRQNIM